MRTKMRRDTLKKLIRCGLVDVKHTYEHIGDIGYVGAINTNWRKATMKWYEETFGWMASGVFINIDEDGRGDIISCCDSYDIRIGGQL